MDDCQTEITIITLDDLFTFYDTLCDILLYEFSCNIEDLDDIDSYDLIFNDKVLSKVNNNNNGWYNLEFKNGTVNQSQSLNDYSIQSPLFSELVCMFMLELYKEVK
jgi:hypothetical protein